METEQQEMAAAYIEEINSKFSYDSYTLTGHSLGGNLAVHALLSSPPEMWDKIERCYSLDGPGVAEDYIAEHQVAIDALASKIMHYHFSLVGAILSPIPGSTYIDVKSEAGSSVIDSLTFANHNLGKLMTDGDGNVVADTETDENDNTLYKSLGKARMIITCVGLLQTVIRAQELY